MGAAIQQKVEFDAPWKRALAAFEKEGHSYGTRLDHEWFYLAMDIKDPKECSGYDAFSKAQFAYMAQLKAFEVELLHEKKMALRSVRGVGYEVVLPGDQTTWAMDKAENDIRQALRKASQRVFHVNLSALTADQRRENSDAQAKLSFFGKGVRSLGE